MLQIIPSPNDDVIVVKATGLLSDEDYREFVPKLEELINRQGRVCLLVEFENFKGWDPKALWADFKLGLEHPDNFKKIAIVGEKAWHHLFAVVVRAFSGAEVRYFEHDQIKEAWEWIREKEASDKEQAGAEDNAVPQHLVPLKPYSRIIVAMDFSPHAEKALERAVEIARHYNASIAVVHACESLMRYAIYPDDLLGPSLSLPMYDPELDQQIFDSAKKRLEEMVQKTDYHDISAEVIWGSPASTVISYAESQEADLIVTGSHGRKGIARLLGSTANSIMHSARCDVLVVRID